MISAQLNPSKTMMQFIHDRNLFRVFLLVELAIVMCR